MKLKENSIHMHLDKDSPKINVAIVILTMNQREKTLRCLKSFLKVRYPHYRILLWDNGSQDATVEAVKKAFPDVMVHYHHDNIGVASGRNQAVKIAIAEFRPSHLLFIDNDMTVSPDFLQLLLSPFQGDPYLAQTTGKILDLNDHRRIYGAGGCRIQFWRGNTMHVGYGEIDKGQYDTSTKCYPSGGCMLVPATIFKKLGGFHTIFDPYGPEDLDFGLRARKAGYYGLYVPEAIVYHESKPGHTFEGGMYTEIYARHRSRHWLILMRNHAPFWQKLLFLSITAPYLFFKVLFREVRKGNFSAMKGLILGAFDIKRSKSHS